MSDLEAARSLQGRSTRMGNQSPRSSRKTALGLPLHSAKRSSSSSRSPKRKLLQNEKSPRLPEDDDLIIIPEERSERFQVRTIPIEGASGANKQHVSTPRGDVTLPLAQDRHHCPSLHSPTSSQSRKSLRSTGPRIRQSKSTSDLRKPPHSAPSTKKKSFKSPTRRMLLISLDSERSLVSVPEQIDMKDFSEVSEEDPMLNNSISTSGWGSWRDWNDRSSAGSEAESLKSAKLRVDEAFLDYTIAENAALKLQRSFRLKKREQELLVDVPLKDGRGAADDDSNDPNKVSEGDDEPTDRSSWYALLFLGLFGLLQTIATCGNTCFMNSDRLDPNTVPMDGAVNGAPAGNGGGGGGGAPPPGLEAMAGQAAGAASSSAGAGASAGAAAGKFIYRG